VILATRGGVVKAPRSLRDSEKLREPQKFGIEGFGGGFCRVKKLSKERGGKNFTRLWPARGQVSSPLNHKNKAKSKGHKNPTGLTVRGTTLPRSKFFYKGKNVKQPWEGERGGETRSICELGKREG